MQPAPIQGCRLDHLVWGVPDLDQGVAAVGEAIGIVPTRGGSHVGRGTANFLASLGGFTYLEIIGPDASQPAPRGARPFGVDELSAPRLVTFAVSVGDIDATSEELRRRGHDPAPAHAMQRALPDGSVLTWRLTEAPAWAGGVVPFLIEWGDGTHPSQSCAQGASLVSLRAQHPDASRVRAVWSALGLEHEVDTGRAPHLEALVRGATGSMTLESRSD